MGIRRLVLAAVLVLAPAVGWAYAAVAPSPPMLGASRPAAVERTTEPEPELALLSSRMEVQGRYAVFEGTVQNQSGSPLRNVMAVVVQYGESEQPRATADALIQENPLMPGQVSGWRVTLRNHPEYPLFGVELRAWHVSAIPTREDRKAERADKLWPCRVLDLRLGSYERSRWSR